MYYTYVLISQNRRRTYTGSTSNIQKRFEEHNSGKVQSSKPFRPFKLLLCEEFEKKSDAKTKELFYKSRTGRRKLKEFITHFNNNAGTGTPLLGGVPSLGKFQ